MIEAWRKLLDDLGVSSAANVSSVTSNRSFNGRSTVIRWYPKSELEKTFTLPCSGCSGSPATATASPYSRVTVAMCSLPSSLRLSPRDLRIFCHWSRASSSTTLPLCSGLFLLVRIQKYVEMPVL